MPALAGCAELLGLESSYTHGEAASQTGAASTAASTGGSGGAGQPMGGGGSIDAAGWPDSATAYCIDPYDLIMGEIPCSAVPTQDGSRTDLVTPSYELDGTTLSIVKDQVTGLTWTRYLIETYVDFGAAEGACQGLRLDGELAWRLPTRVELQSLSDHGSGTTYHVAFELNGNAIWTSTPDPVDRRIIPPLQVTIGSGGVYPMNPADFAQTVCVSGELAPSTLSLSAAQDTVWDSRTALMWEQGQGESWLTWADALARCDESMLAGFDDWRLPTRKEFATIVDDAKMDAPFIRDPLASAVNAQYWTSTPYQPGAAIVHNFAVLGDYALSVTEHVGARCVRSSTTP